MLSGIMTILQIQRLHDEPSKKKREGTAKEALTSLNISPYNLITEAVGMQDKRIYGRQKVSYRLNGKNLSFISSVINQK